MHGVSLATLVAAIKAIDRDGRMPFFIQEVFGMERAEMVQLTRIVFHRFFSREPLLLGQALRRYFSTKDLSTCLSQVQTQEVLSAYANCLSIFLERKNVWVWEQDAIDELNESKDKIEAWMEIVLWLYRAMFSGDVSVAEDLCWSSGNSFDLHKVHKWLCKKTKDLQDLDDTVFLDFRYHVVGGLQEQKPDGYWDIWCEHMDNLDK